MTRRSFIIFLSIVLTIYGLINTYIFIRGWNTLPDDPPLLHLVYAVVFGGCALAYPVGRFLERSRFPALSVPIVWVGAFWLAAMTYFFLLVLTIDLLRFLNFVVPFFSPVIVAPTDQTKLLFFALLTSGVGIVVALGAWNAARPRLKNLRLRVAKDGRQLPSIRIAVASDIHLGTIVSTRRLKRIVGMINDLQPDIVLLPGDVVDEDLAPVIRYNLGETLRTIKARYGVIAITGNHEYIGGVEPAVHYLQEHGMMVLRDNAVLIADSLYIIGREDRSIGQFAGRQRVPLAELMKDVDRSFPIILMDHQPFHLEEAEQAGVDMQLSGHTHHGQLWPFNYITNKVYEVSWGYKQKGNTHIYVSCGVGTWGPPVRTGNRPEILMIELTFDATGAA